MSAAGLGNMATDLLAALRNASNAFSVCPTAFSAISRTTSGTCMVIFGSIADFSIDLFRDVAPFAASAVFEIEDTCRDGETLCGDFLFAVFFVERASLSARIMPFLVRLYRPPELWLCLSSY